MRPVRERVLSILAMAMNEHAISNGYETMPCPDGWVPWFVFSSIDWCGSTQGDRRLRELRTDPKIIDKYDIEKKHDGQKYYYRLRQRQAVRQGSLAFTETRAA